MGGLLGGPKGMLAPLSKYWGGGGGCFPPPPGPLFLQRGGARFRILGGQGAANSQQAHDVALTSMRRNDVASTSFRRHVPARFLIYQCQMIPFLILKSDNIENSRIELKRIVLQVPSNQIKVTLLFYPSTWYICDFFSVSHKKRSKL